MKKYHQYDADRQPANVSHDYYSRVDQYPSHIGYLRPASTQAPQPTRPKPAPASNRNGSKPRVAAGLAPQSRGQNMQAGEITRVGNKGFGFIRCKESGDEVFFKTERFEGEAPPFVGQKVRFAVQEGNRGKFARIVYPA